jgi:hypothetical protein
MRPAYSTSSHHRKPTWVSKHYDFQTSSVISEVRSSLVLRTALYLHDSETCFLRHCIDNNSDQGPGNFQLMKEATKLLVFDWQSKV